MNKLYSKFEAFDLAFEKAKELDPDDNRIDGKFNLRHYDYLSNPEKIKGIHPVHIYSHWFDELFRVSQKLVADLNRLSKNMENSKISWLGLFFKKKKINDYFQQLYIINNDLSNFKSECYEFQRCILATSIYQNTDMAEMLQEQIRYIDTIETRITQTGDRKLLSINNSRMHLIGLLLSITAIAVSVTSIFLN